MTQKTYHILNGDALKEQFPSSIAGEVIVLRECFVEGPVTAGSSDELYKVRAAFLHANYGVGDSKYEEKTIPELEKLEKIEEKSEVHFWFEDDLFCQVNFWYALHRTASKAIDRFLVRPTELTPYGFGRYDSKGLEKLLAGRMTITDHATLATLWTLYAADDLTGLSQQALQVVDRFPFVAAAVEAHKQRQPREGFRGRPVETLVKIQNELKTNDFGPVFKEFSTREPIYGFGDLQVKRLWDQINQ